jgi:hypothetical protein
MIRIYEKYIYFNLNTYIKLCINMYIHIQIMYIDV